MLLAKNEWPAVVDAAGNVYPADGATSVYRIDTNGILTIFAGAG